MKRVLITGANSYIGTSVENYLTQWPEGYHVDTIDMKDGFWQEKSFEGYDSIFHVAGIAHINTKKLDNVAQEKYWAVNANLPVDVAKKAKEEGVAQFIFLSSMSVYGEHGCIRNPVVIDKHTPLAPKDIYGKSKRAAEIGLQTVSDSFFKICLVRPPMVYGPGSKGNYQSLVKASKLLPVFPEIMNERSMLHISNLCSFVKQLIDENAYGIFLPQDEEYVCTSAMVKKLASEQGRTIKMTQVFNPIIRALSGKISLLDKVFGSLVYEKNGNSY